MSTSAVVPIQVASRVSAGVSRCSIALVVLALLAFGSSGGGAGAVLGLAMAGLGWWLTTGERALKVPKWLIAAALLIVVARGVWTLGNRPSASIAPFLTFLTSILVVKCWESRGVRDIAQVLAIATFVLIGAALGSNDFATGLLIAMAFPFLVHGSMLLQLDIAQARAEQISGMSTQPKHPAGRHPMRLSAGLIAIGVALAAGVFVLVPRTQGASGLSALGFAGAKVSGFRDRVELGKAGLLSQSQAIVMEVDVPSGEGLPSISGAQGELYLRGAVLTSYNHQDGNWKRGDVWDELTELRGVDFPPRESVSLTTDRTREGVELVIRDKDRAGEMRPVFSVWRPQSVSHSSRDGVTIDVMKESGSAAFPTTVPAEYRVVCALEAGSPLQDARRLGPAHFSNSVIAFAQRALADSGISPDPLVRPSSEDFRAVRTLEQFLRQQFKYTRQLGAPPDGVPPLDWFIDSAREGHCEYFACALAALCRTIGINARVVTGYMTGEFDMNRRTYTVRQAGAHAWVEAEIVPGRWRTFDATPSEELSRLAGAESGVMLKLERWLASVETAWNASVVNYGHASGQRTARDGAVARTLWRWSQRIEAWIESLGIVRAVTWVLIVIGGISLLIAATGFAIKTALRGVFRRRQRSVARRGEASRLYERLLKACSRLGHQKPAWLGALEHVRSLPEDVRTPAEQVVMACYGSFFAGREIEDPAAVRQALTTIEKAAQSARK